MSDSSEAESTKPDVAERREQPELLSRTLDREAHILMQEPEALPELRSMAGVNCQVTGPGPIE